MVLDALREIMSSTIQDTTTPDNDIPTSFPPPPGADNQTNDQDLSSFSSPVCKTSSSETKTDSSACTTTSYAAEETAFLTTSQITNNTKSDSSPVSIDLKPQTFAEEHLSTPQPEVPVQSQPQSPESEVPSISATIPVTQPATEASKPPMPAEVSEQHLSLEVTSSSTPPNVPPPPPPSFGFVDTGRPKMKKFHWNEIPASSLKEDSVWKRLQTVPDPIDIDEDKIKELFSIKESILLTGIKEEKDGASHHEVELLDKQISLALNVLLKRFGQPDDLIEMIKSGEFDERQLEALKEIQHILLLHEKEIEAVTGYDGDVAQLAKAEQFCYKLFELLPHYKFRIEMLVFKGDFSSQLDDIRSNADVLSTACGKLLESQSLQMFLKLVLSIGNFLNKGNRNEGAKGFQISSLNKLPLIKSTTGDMTLLQFLVEEALAKNKGILNFVDELLEPLQRAKGLTFNQIESLEKWVLEMKASFEEANDEVKQQFSNFILETERGLDALKEVSASVKKLSCKLAVYFCENEKSFKLNEFLEIITEFCDKVKACKQGLATRKAEQSKTVEEKNQEDIQFRGTRRLRSLTFPCDQAGNVVSELANNKIFKRVSRINSGSDEGTAESIKL